MAFTEKSFSKHLLRCNRQCEFGEWDTVRMQYIRCTAKHLERSPKGWLFQLSLVDYFINNFGAMRKVTKMYCQTHAMEHARTMVGKK